jgi:hypothetical protein
MGSTPNDVAQTCGGLAPGVTDLPIDRIEATLRLTEEQLRALDALKAASSQASEALKSSCTSEVPQTPLGRLDAVQKRIGSMIQASAIVRTSLDNFYNSLNDEQRQRFATLAPTSTAGPTAADLIRAMIWLRCAAVAQKDLRKYPRNASKKSSSPHNSSWMRSRG